MGRLYLVQLDGKIYSCHICGTHLAHLEELVSKGFHSRHGRAYLFNNVVNVSEGPLEDRQMTTGMHTVADIHCKGCHRIVGWKYELAPNDDQKYKEGKFILEREKVVGCESKDFYLDQHQHQHQQQHQHQHIGHA